MKETLHIYRRVSTQQQIEKYSLENQLEEGIKKSKELGMNYRDWNEEGVSGFSENMEDRVVLTDLFVRVEKGDIKHLFCFDLSRLSRDDIVSNILKSKMEEMGVKLYTTESSIDFMSDESGLMYSFFSVMNNFFVKVSRKKSMMGKVSHFKNGGWRGGSFPMGYTSKEIDGRKILVIDKEDSKWVRKIFEWYDKGKSPTEIGMELDKNGVKPKRSKLWGIGSIQTILRNELYLGKDEMIDNITNPQKPKKLYYRSERLQIIPTTLFNRVRDKVKFQRSLRNQINKTKHKVLLRGKIFCDCCGEIWGCRVKPKKYEYYYYCRSKENNWRKVSEKKKVKCDIKKGMNIHNTDKLVWDTLCEILNDSNLIKEELKSRKLGKKLDTQKEVKKKVKHLTQQRKYLEDKISEYDSREEDLYDWYVKGEISKKRLEELKKKFVELRKEKFEELERMEIDIQSIHNRVGWVDWLDKHHKWIRDIETLTDLDKRIEIVNGYVDKIMVNFDNHNNIHILKIFLKLPIVDDEYKSKGNKKGKREYEIIDGGKSIVKELEYKVGRKPKKDGGKNWINPIIQMVMGIPPIIDTPSPWNKQ
tara:strand:+ start:278 stop:2038 length:1761 start_codon:yes stop_codon:yes gene_type:complete